MNLGKFFTSFVAISAGATGLIGVDARPMPNANSNARGHHLRGQELKPLTQNRADAGVSVSDELFFHEKFGLPLLNNFKKHQVSPWVDDYDDDHANISSDEAAKEPQGQVNVADSETAPTAVSNQKRHFQQSEDTSVIPSLDDELSNLLLLDSTYGLPLLSDTADTANNPNNQKSAWLDEQKPLSKDSNATNTENTSSTSETAKAQAAVKENNEFNGDLVLENDQKPEDYKLTFEITEGMSFMDVLTKNFPEVPWGNPKMLWDKLVPTKNNTTALPEKHSHYKENAGKGVYTQAFFDAVVSALKKYIDIKELPKRKRSRECDDEISRLKVILGKMQEASLHNILAEPIKAEISC